MIKKFEEYKFLAVPFNKGENYYIVSAEWSQHPDEIEITQEEYETLLKNNQEKNLMVRGYRKEDGTIGVKSVAEIQPSLYHYWDIETGSWKEDLELKEKILTEEYIQSVNSGIAWASSEIENIQELVDFNEADAEEEAHLLDAKKYRVALNLVKRSGDFPNLEVELPERPY